MELAYLIAVYILGTRYHSGQASKGYRLAYIADERARRSGIDLGRQVENLADRRKKKIYTKEHIKMVACCLRKLRKYRFDL